MSKHYDNNYVISSRIRLARNINGCKFPKKLDLQQSAQIIDAVSKPLMDNVECTKYILSQMSEVDIVKLKEQHLISNALIENRAKSAVVIDVSQRISLMINEEDIVRLQLIYEGFQLQECYKQACLVDKLISQYVNYSYDDKLGYLTACPTNVGTGLRASVMLFLPALSIANKITNLISNVTRSKMTLRGVYGEGTKADGYLYQLSNQQTLGLTEQEIIDMVTDGVNKIVQAEEQERNNLYQNNKISVSDKVGRAWGILNNCYSISGAEFWDLVSWVKLGSSLGILKLADPGALDKLIIQCQPANFSSTNGNLANDVSMRDQMRATFVKQALKRLT